MADEHDIELRYFNARGRAQFLRYYFTCRGVAFRDHRVPLSADFNEWRAVRDDQAITGPFKRLPVLGFDGEQVAETLAIANFLHERLGDASRLSGRDNLRHEMLLSSLYGDLMVTLGMLVWATRMYPGVDLAEHLKLALTRIRGYLAVLDQALAGWSWVSGNGTREPLIADCMLWEELDVLGTIFGGFLEIADFETLARFYGESPARDELIRYRDSHPCPFSGNPSEPESIQAIRDTLNSMEVEGAS